MTRSPQPRTSFRTRVPGGNGRAVSEWVVGDRATTLHSAAVNEEAMKLIWLQLREITQK
jgi:hypothetical protein